MNDDARTLAALAALGDLTPEQADEVARMAAADPEFAQLLLDDRALVAALASVGPPVPPPADLGRRIVAAATMTGPQATLARPRPEPRRSWTRRLQLGLTAVAAAVAGIVGTYAVMRDAGGDTPRLTAEVSPHDAGGPVHGTVALYDPDSPEGRIVVRLEGLPAAPSGHHYEVWVLRRGATNMEAVAAFTPSASTTRIEARLPGPANYAAIDVSLEDDAGPPEHSGTSVAGAALGT